MGIPTDLRALAASDVLSVAGLLPPPRAPAPRDRR